MAPTFTLNIANTSSSKTKIAPKYVSIKSLVLLIEEHVHEYNVYLEDTAFTFCINGFSRFNELVLHL